MTDDCLKMFFEAWASLVNKGMSVLGGVEMVVLSVVLEGVVNILYVYVVVGLKVVCEGVYEEDDGYEEEG